MHTDLYNFGEASTFYILCPKFHYGCQKVVEFPDPFVQLSCQRVLQQFRAVLQSGLVHGKITH
jgi:hypothetical protein